jgi:hypothetical protein
MVDPPDLFKLMRGHLMGHFFLRPLNTRFAAHAVVVHPVFGHFLHHHFSSLFHVAYFLSKTPQKLKGRPKGVWSPRPFNFACG